MKLFPKIFLFLCLAVPACATDVQIKLTDSRFNVQPFANRPIWIRYQNSPNSFNEAVALYTIIQTNTDVNGQFILSNAVPGLYLVTVQAPPQRADFNFVVINESLGLIQAADYLVVTKANSYVYANAVLKITSTNGSIIVNPPSGVGVVDLSGGGGPGSNSVVVAQGTNVVLTTNSGVVTINSTTDTNVVLGVVGGNFIRNLNGIGTNTTFSGQVSITNGLGSSTNWWSYHLLGPNLEIYGDNQPLVNINTNGQLQLQYFFQPVINPNTVLVGADISGALVAVTNINDIAMLSNAFANLQFTNLFVSNLYATNIYVTNGFFSTIYVSNLFATNIFASNAFITNLTVQYLTNLTEFHGKTIITTNLYVTNLFALNSRVDNLTVTNGQTNLSMTANTIAAWGPDKNLTNVPNALGALTNNGAGLFGWFDFSTAGGTSPVTNDGAFLYLTGTGPNHPDGSAGGPPWVMRNDGSLFQGTNVAQEILESQYFNQGNLKVLYPSVAVAFSDIGQPNQFFRTVRVANNTNNSSYAYILDYGTNHPSKAQARTSWAATGSGRGGSVQIAADSTGLGGGSITIQNNTNGVDFHVGGDGNVDTIRHASGFEWPRAHALGALTNDGSGQLGYYDYSANASPQVWTNDGTQTFLSAELTNAVTYTRIVTDTNQGFGFSMGLNLPGAIGPQFSMFGQYPNEGTNVQNSVQFGSYSVFNNTFFEFDSTDSGASGKSGTLSELIFSPSSPGLLLESQDPTQGRSGVFLKSTQSGTNIFAASDDGHVFLNGLEYVPPATNALPGQVLGSLGDTPQTLYWTNLPAAGITGGTTNFATTNSNTGLTNAIQSIISGSTSGQMWVTNPVTGDITNVNSSGVTITTKGGLQVNLAGSGGNTFEVYRSGVLTDFIGPSSGSGAVSFDRGSFTSDGSGDIGAVGITLGSLSASTVLQANGTKSVSSIANASGALTNDGAGNFGWYNNFAGGIGTGPFILTLNGFGTNTAFKGWSETNNLTGNYEIVTNGLLSIIQSNNTANVTNGLVLSNNVSASNGNPKPSPGIEFAGNGAVSSVSRPYKFRIFNQPLGGSDAEILRIQASSNNSGWYPIFDIDQVGNITNSAEGHLIIGQGADYIGFEPANGSTSTSIDAFRDITINSDIGGASAGIILQVANTTEMQIYTAQVTPKVGQVTVLGTQQSPWLNFWIRDIFGTNRAAASKGRYAITNGGWGPVVYFGTNVFGHTNDAILGTNTWEIDLPGVTPAFAIHTNGSINAHLNSTLGSDQTTTSATLASTTLGVTLSAGRTYTFDAMFFLSDSVSSDGAVIDFNGGSATATTFIGQATGFDTALNFTTRLSALSSTATATTFTGNGSFEVHGTIFVNAAGTLIPRFAQNAHTTGTLTLSKGSYIRFIQTP